MKKALINPKETPHYVSGWKDYTTVVLSPVPNSVRVVTVVAQEFPVTDPLFWVNCADSVVPDQYYYNTTTKKVLPIPESAAKPAISSKLSSSVDENDTTLTLTNAENFSSAGEIKVGTESMVYHGKDGNSLLNIMRGIHETTAAPHAAGSTVTLI